MGVGDTKKENHTKKDVLPSQTLSHWSLIPLGKSESQCRTHLRVSRSRDGELRYFFSSCQLVTDSGCHRGNISGHFQPATPAMAREQSQAKKCRCWPLGAR